MYINLKPVGRAIKNFIKKDVKKNLSIVLVSSIVLYIAISYLIARAFAMMVNINNYSIITFLFKKENLKNYGLLLTAIFFAYLLFSMFLIKEENINNLGDSKIADYKALRGLIGKNGLLLSRNVQLSEETSCEHVLICGPTGSGKSSTFFIPNLLNIPQNSSIIVTDPKGELYRKTRAYNESIGRQCMVFSPLDPQNSIPYNPLELAKDITEVRELAQAIIINGANSVALAMGQTVNTSAEWTNMAVPLFVASLLYCKNKGGEFCNIQSALELILSKTEEELQETFSEDPIVEMQYNIFKQASSSKKTLGSIKITLASNLQLFTDPKICMVTIGKGFNPKILRDKPTAIFIVCPEIKSSYVSPLMSVFYMQVLNKVMEYTGENLQVYAMLDEFANVGVIPNFGRLASTCRSRKLSLAIGLQGIEQLEENYGQKAGENILNNLKTKIFYSGLAPTTARYASEICGYTTVDTKSCTKNNKEEVSTSYSVQRRELLTVDEIRRLQQDKVLLVLHNRLPVIDKQNIYYKDKKFIDKVGEYY